MNRKVGASSYGQSGAQADLASFPGKLIDNQMISSAGLKLFTWWLNISLQCCDVS